MNKDYIFHESTISICSKCLKRVPAKFVIKNEKVFLTKTCPEHGKQEVLFEEDVEYYLNKRSFDKPGKISQTQTSVSKGCPFDCGLCPEHDQHTCIGLIEVTTECNLNCPECYAKGEDTGYLPLDKISEMLDFFISAEGGEAEILQISGGEPTLHPEIIQVIKLARSKNIKYVMLNTNGIRIAQDEAFVKELAEFKGKFEVYLQFDGISREIYTELRDRDLLDLKLNAIENLIKYEIPITLVTTVKKGVNDNELGRIINFGIEKKSIRGVNFQPLGHYGEIKFAKSLNNITLSGIIKKIEEQSSGLIRKGDIVPLPCNVERVGITFLYKSKRGKFIPITRNFEVKNYLSLIDNTFAFDAARMLKNKDKKEITESNCCNMKGFVKNLKSIIPLSFNKKPKEEKLKYINENTFRINVTSFIDAYNFDLKSMQKECVHIITPDLKRIPFSSYNMFYRK